MSNWWLGTPKSLLYGDKGDFLAVTGLTRDANLTNFVKEIINDKAELKTHALDIPEELSHLIAFSDHINYWNLGVPVAFLTDTAFYRNHNYHRETDTWDTLDYDKMAKLADGLYQVIRAIDTTPVK